MGEPRRACGKCGGHPRRVTAFNNVLCEVCGVAKSLWHVRWLETPEGRRFLEEVRERLARLLAPRGGREE